MEDHPRTHTHGDLHTHGSPGGVSPGEEKEGYGWKDLQKRKILSLEAWNEGVMG